jgi:hypothetical protein
MASSSEHIGLYLISAFPTGVIVLSLESGNLLHLDPRFLNVARAIAQGVSVAKTIDCASECLGLPRYVARERVRNLHHKLDGDLPPLLAAAAPEKFGVRSGYRVGVHHLSERAASGADIEVLALGSAVRRVAVVGNAEPASRAFMQSIERTARSTVGMPTLGLRLVSPDAVAWGAIDHVWFPEHKRRRSLGLTLTSVTRDCAFFRVLSSITSNHNPKEWLKLFHATAQLFAGAQAFDVAAPTEPQALEQAISEFLLSQALFSYSVPQASA